MFVSYFPFFVEMEGKSALVAGGGTVALGKIEKLLPYGPGVTVVAPEISENIRRIPGLQLFPRPFRPGDLEGKSFVVAATGERAVNRRIAALCRERGLLVNVVDDPSACTFLFPALIKRGELSVGISTGGASPSAAIWLKERIAAVLPDRLEEILAYLGAARPAIKEALPEAARARAFPQLFRLCIERGRPLEAGEAEACLNVALRGEGKNVP